MCLVLKHVMGFFNGARDDKLMSLLVFSSLVSLLIVLSICLKHRGPLTAAAAAMYSDD